MLPFIVLAHVTVIVSANYLTQYPFEFFGFHTTYGAFTFPLIFLFTDLTVRLIGAPAARRVILTVSLPVIVISYLVGTLFYKGEFQPGALGEFNSFAFRVAVASFLAYAVGQLLDITVFNRLRQAQFPWWAAPAGSMTLGNLVDSLVFFGFAFYASIDPFMADHWFDIAMFDTVFKIGISLLFLLPAYGAVVRRVVGSLRIA
jgi:uncharacterized integral membrane protein (TIGR00697 family)